MEQQLLCLKVMVDSTVVGHCLLHFPFVRLCFCFSYFFCLILKLFTVRSIIIINIFNFVFIRIPQNVLMSQNNHHYILTYYIHQHDYIKIFSIVFQYVVDFYYAWPKWCIIFKCGMFSWQIIILISFKIYSPFQNNISITIVTQI